MIKVGNEEHYAILGGYDHNTNLLEISAVDKNINVEKTSITDILYVYFDNHLTI